MPELIEYDGYFIYSHKVLDNDLINAMYDELAPIVDEMKDKAWMYDGLNK